MSLEQIYRKNFTLSVLFENNGCLDFILDGMDLDNITFDSKQRKKYMEGWESITEAELRKLFRCVIQDPSCLEKVTFWKEGRKVCPPWIDEKTQDIKDNWKDYYEKQLIKKTHLLSQNTCEKPFKER